MAQNKQPVVVEGSRTIFLPTTVLAESIAIALVTKGVIARDDLMTAPDRLKGAINEQGKKAITDAKMRLGIILP